MPRQKADTGLSTSAIQSAAFISAQDEPDQHLLRLSEVEADAESQTVTVRCSEATKRAIQLQSSQNLEGWSHEVVVD